MQLLEREGGEHHWPVFESAIVSGNNLLSLTWNESDVSCMCEYSMAISTVKVLDPLVQAACITNLKKNQSKIQSLLSLPK